MGRSGRGRCGLLPGEAAGQSGLERGGAQQAAGDAREDLSDVDGAEVSRDIGGVGGGGALLQRAGELPAVIDQRAQEGEKASGGGSGARNIFQGSAATPGGPCVMAGEA
jgi:hypothetical protein